MKANLLVLSTFELPIVLVYLLYRLHYHRNHKVKVKVTLEQATKAQRGNRAIALLFILGARWRWVVNVTPRPLYPRKAASTHCVGGWVDPRDGLGGCGKSRLHWDSISGPYSPW
jgi:hypothetical protein